MTLDHIPQLHPSRRLIFTSRESMQTRTMYTGAVGTIIEDRPYLDVRPPEALHGFGFWDGNPQAGRWSVNIRDGRGFKYTQSDTEYTDAHATLDWSNRRWFQPRPPLGKYVRYELRFRKNTPNAQSLHVNTVITRPWDDAGMEDPEFWVWFRANCRPWFIDRAIDIASTANVAYVPDIYCNSTIVMTGFQSRDGTDYLLNIRSSDDQDHGLTSVPIHAQALAGYSAPANIWGYREWPGGYIANQGASFTIESQRATGAGTIRDLVTFYGWAV